jgi:hypothetical protein
MWKGKLLLLIISVVCITSCQDYKQKNASALENGSPMSQGKELSFDGVWVGIDNEGNFIDKNILKITKKNDRYEVELILDNQKGKGLFSITDHGILTGKISTIGSLSIDRINHIDKKLNGALSIILTDTPDVIELGLFKQKSSSN